MTKDREILNEFNIFYGKTIAEYVEERIHGVFMSLAKFINDIPMSEEESAGVPMKLFQGETLLINVWRQYVKAEKLKEYSEDYFVPSNP